jgi:hypothetical protein
VSLAHRPAVAIRPLRGVDTDRLVAAGLMVLVAVPLIVFILYPLFAILRKSIEVPGGVGLAHYIRYFGQARFLPVLSNTSPSRSRPPSSPSSSPTSSPMPCTGPCCPVAPCCG